MDTTPPDGDNLDLKDQNELKKLKLTLETGATFFESEDTDLPPEIEADWLANIEAFEAQFAHAKTTTLFNLLGQPEYKPVEELTDSAITLELARLLDVMEKQSCFVEIESPLSDEQQYRFITEELFASETNDMRVPGMMLVYSYEEFHPNNEYDLRRYTAEFFPQIFRNIDGIAPDWLNLAEQVVIGNKTYNHQEIKVFLTNLFQLCDSIEMTSLDITHLVMEENSAVVDFEIAIKTNTNSIPTQLKGIGQFCYITELGYWSISEIKLPVLGF